MTATAGVRRRSFLIGAGGAAATIGGVGFQTAAFAQNVSKLPPFLNWKDPNALIVHGDNSVETKRGDIGTSICTATNNVFLQNHLKIPDPSILADRDAWTVQFDGVRKARSMTLGELKSLGIATVATVLQCSGNGRAFFEHEAGGAKWETGAAGCILWSGAPVSAVVEAFGGVAEGRSFMTSTGGEDLPTGKDPLAMIVERSVPAEAMQDAILAWEMNGEPLPLAHGGPLRIVIPGYFAVNNVKFLNRLAFTDAESPAAIQQTEYRIRPVGEKAAPDQPSMWKMPVKSWVTHPLAEMKAGRMQIYGVAMGGGVPVDRVEVTTDGGSTWFKAEFVGPDIGRYAWRPFVAETDLSPGSYRIASRATDASGDTQPEKFESNEGGYGHNGWRDHEVSIEVV